MSKRWLGIGLTLLVLIGGGLTVNYLFFSGPDFREMADENVEDEWLTSFEQVDALEFFEAGGHYIDFGDGTDEEFVDRDVVVPLIERLNTEAGMDWKVLPDPTRPGFAFAIVARIPDDSSQRAAMTQIVAEEEAKFGGQFIEQKGYRWLSYEFIPASMADMLGEMEL